MIGLIAGQGTLPEVLSATLAERGTAFRLCALDGFVPDGWHGKPVERFRLETLGSLLHDLSRSGVTEVCFAGRVTRPQIDPAKVDERTRPLLKDMVHAITQGDDAALRILAGFFEAKGMTVIGAHEVAPHLTPSSGCATVAQPTDLSDRDAARGQEIVSAMGSLDVGQTCIVSKNQALAIEALGGTDWMMRSLLAHSDALPHEQNPPDQWLDRVNWMLEAPEDRMPKRNPTLPKGGILYKAAKPQQDLRFDMPTIGPQTLMMAAECGLDGVVVEADRVIVLDFETCLSIADAAKLFLWVRPSGATA